MFPGWPQSSSEVEIDAAQDRAQGLIDSGWVEVSDAFAHYRLAARALSLLVALGVEYREEETELIYVADATQVERGVWVPYYVGACLLALDNLPRATPEDRGLCVESVYGYLRAALDAQELLGNAVASVFALGGSEVVCDLLVASGVWDGAMPTLPAGALDRARRSLCVGDDEDDVV